MGLDMYLEGRTFNWQFGADRPMKDGFPVKGEILELGYWRKHPDLHGYIVNTFADGVDDCKEIWLNEEAIQKIIEAIKNKELPKTEGFFFGDSDGSEDEESIAIFEKALAWLTKATPPVERKFEPIGDGNLAMKLVQTEDFVDAKESRSVYYIASW